MDEQKLLKVLDKRYASLFRVTTETSIKRFIKGYCIKKFGPLAGRNYTIFIDYFDNTSMTYAELGRKNNLTHEAPRLLIKRFASAIRRHYGSKLKSLIA